MYEHRYEIVFNLFFLLIFQKKEKKGKFFLLETKQYGFFVLFVVIFVVFAIGGVFVCFFCKQKKPIKISVRYL